MKQILRFSISGTVGFIITAALFIGMLSLLSNKTTTVANPTSDISFSFVNNLKEPEITPPKKLEKPIQEKVIQPPAAPNLSIETQLSPEVNLPTVASNGKQFNFAKDLSFPDIDGGGGYGIDSQGTVTAAIAPIYPHDALVNTAQGWVKVQISVNEFGTVNEVTVLDAKPARIFNFAAKKAVKKWKFHPKTVDGKAQPFTATQTIEFKLDK